jgi:hypothetical protein
MKYRYFLTSFQWSTSIPLFFALIENRMVLAWILIGVQVALGIIIMINQRKAVK